MVEVMYSLDKNHVSKDLDEVQCVQSMRRRFVWRALSSYISTLMLMSWPDIEAPAVGRWAGQLQQFEENLSSIRTLQAYWLGWGETVPPIPAIQRQYVLLFAHTSHHLSYQVRCSLLKGKGTTDTFACHPVVLSA